MLSVYVAIICVYIYDEICRIHCILWFYCMSGGSGATCRYRGGGGGVGPTTKKIMPPGKPIRCPLSFCSFLLFLSDLAAGKIARCPLSFLLLDPPPISDQRKKESDYSDLIFERFEI